ncbi:hypothetical protein [Leptospira ryugenii]|nr:hypothetical protein [Leptospira ryugenii]
MIWYIRLGLLFALSFGLVLYQSDLHTITQEVESPLKWEDQLRISLQEYQVKIYKIPKVGESFSTIHEGEEVEIKIIETDEKSVAKWVLTGYPHHQSVELTLVHKEAEPKTKIEIKSFCKPDLVSRLVCASFSPSKNKSKIETWAASILGAPNNR